MKLKRNGLDLEVLSNKIIHISWGRYISEEPKYVKTAKQIREAEQLRLLPPPQTVMVEPPKSINQPVQKGDTFSHKDYFNPAIQPKIQDSSNRYMLPQDAIPQRNMSEPIMNLGPRPTTTRTTERIHKPNPDAHQPKRKYTRRTRTDEISAPTQEQVLPPSPPKSSSRIIFN